MTLEQTIILFACIALALTVATITLLVVDAHRSSGRFGRNRYQEQERERERKRTAIKPARPVSAAFRRAPRSRRYMTPIAYGGGYVRIPKGAFLGVLGGLLSGTIAATAPFLLKCKQCCRTVCCGRGKRRFLRRRGVRSYRF